MAEFKPKSFWKKPEGKTGAVVLGALVLGAGALAASFGLTLLGSLMSGGVVAIASTLLALGAIIYICLLYTSPSPRDQRGSRMPSSA